MSIATHLRLVMLANYFLRSLCVKVSTVVTNSLLIQGFPITKVKTILAALEKRGVSLLLFYEGTGPFC